MWSSEWNLMVSVPMFFSFIYHELHLVASLSALNEWENQCPLVYLKIDKYACIDIICRIKYQIVGTQALTDY